MDETPLVSVAMATFNGEKFLREQLDSIYSQTYKNIEVVVTDDCSSDETKAILEEYKDKYGLRYYLNKENLGLTKNFEKAMSLCKGDLIALADQDDIWLQHKLETLVDEINDFTLIYSSSYLTNEESILIGEPYIAIDESEFHFRENCKQTRQLIANNWVISHAVMFKRELLQWALPIPSGFYFHDAWLAIVASKLNGSKFLNKCLMYYRRHSSSLTFKDREAAKPMGLKDRLAYNSKHNQIKRSSYQNSLITLKSISDFPLFDQNDVAFVKDLIMYYQDYLSSFIHFKSFIVAIKYNNYFCRRQNMFYRLKFVLSSLIKQ